jgi:hypothetical protein
MFFIYNFLGRNVKIVYGIDSLACQDEFFVDSLLDVKENDEHAHDFAVHLSRHEF